VLYVPCQSIPGLRDNTEVSLRGFWKLLLVICSITVSDLSGIPPVGCQMSIKKNPPTPNSVNYAMGKTARNLSYLKILFASIANWNF
jgi:hypothetical protein